MPFIKVKTSCPITNEQEVRIKSLMGKAIELVPGKSEEYLLLEFEDLVLCQDFGQIKLRFFVS